MNKLRNIKGITLISLVITVIIMLILAGVAVSNINSDQGIFAKTEKVVALYEEKAQEEAEIIESLKSSWDLTYNNDSIVENNNTSSKVNIGDFVNYSVTVDGVLYDKWRVLHKDMNGRIEIYCYNGPKFALGDSLNIEKSKSDYANSISLLNAACASYGNGTYGGATRHFGSDPYNPTSYETISTGCIKYYSPDETQSTEYQANLKYLSQEHYSTDFEAIGKIDGNDKFAATHNWVAARRIFLDDEYTLYRVWGINYRGVQEYSNFYYIYNNDNEMPMKDDINLVPVVILESGVYISEMVGNGSKEQPWELKK